MPGALQQIFVAQQIALLNEAREVAKTLIDAMHPLARVARKHGTSFLPLH